jgi:nucleotide-binding universal stress UspA family protein
MLRYQAKEHAMLPKNILVPTDLSEGADHALDYACELARTLGAKVHLLNVIGIPVLGVPELGMALTSTMIDSMISDLILQTAKDLGADLIVMGTHGRRGFTRALLGSVTESVVRSAACPVLTVRRPHDEKSGRHAA